MKLIFSLVLVFSITLFTNDLSAQKSSWNKIRKANKLRLFGNVDKAVKKYEEILTETPNNAAANFQLGKIYLLDFEDYGKAEKYLSTSVKNFDEKDTIYMAFYYLAETQKQLGNFPEAIENFQLFKSKGIKDVVKSQDLVSDVNTKIDECKLAQAYGSDKEYTFTRVINLGENVNSDLSEYCSIFFSETDQLMYTARYQDSDKEKKFMDFKFYEGSYAFSDTNSSETDPTRLKFDEEDKVHFSVVSKTTSGDTVIFYKENKLWISTMNNGKLLQPKLMPLVVNKSYYQPHGVFTPDGKSFIFSSAEKDVQLDLYRSTITGGQWGEAEVLSDVINTKYNEDSPYLSADGKTLYFSSNKPGGFGKYDIYLSKIEDGVFSKPINIGMPINSAGEDIFFSLNQDNKTGFLSSNRNGGFGLMDIYMFTEQPYPSFDCEEYLAANGGEGKNEIKVLDELVINQSVRFDLSKAKLDHANISNIFWKVDDEILKLDSPQLTFLFDTSGEHYVSTQIFGKNRKTDSYVMDCATQKFTINKEGTLFLEIEADRMVKVEDNAIIDAAVFYLGNNKMITDYKWFIDDNDIKTNKQSYNYSFSDTGYHDIKVLATVVDQAKGESYEVTSSKKIFVYDENHSLSIGEDGIAVIPGIDLYDNKNPSDGKINAVKADLYGIPDSSRVFYSWYIDNALVKGRQSELLAYDFKPLSTVTVEALVVPQIEDEEEFTLTASKVIPPFETGVLVVDANPTNSDTTATPSTTTTTTTTTTATSTATNTSTSSNPDSTVAVTTEPVVDVVKLDGISYEIRPVYFYFDKYYLTPKAKAIINNNIAALKANPSLRIVVEGNTDSMGPSAYNLRLSEKRAKS
ncbi:MAG: OmpA family protein, partial [Crocinitomicaceae bacterium]